MLLGLAVSLAIAAVTQNWCAFLAKLRCCIGHEPVVLGEDHVENLNEPPPEEQIGMAEQGEDPEDGLVGDAIANENVMADIELFI